MLAKLLGGSGTESFFDTMSDQEGLVYGVDAQRRPFPDYGLFTVGFTSFASNVPRSVQLIADRIKSLSEHVDHEALETQRQADRSNARAKLREQTIGVDALADDIAIHGQILPRDYFYKLQEKVTPQDVQNAARALLLSMSQHPPTFIASGDLRGLPSSRANQRTFQHAAQEINPARVLRDSIHGEGLLVPL